MVSDRIYWNKGLKMKDLIPNYVNPMKGKKRPDLSEYNRTRINPMKGRKRPDTSERCKKLIGSLNPATRPEVRKKISATRIERKVAVKEKNPAWKGGTQNYRKYAENEYNMGNDCKICGKTVKSYYKHIHHKDKNHRNSKKENLEVLCVKCHFLKHRAMKQIKMEKIVKIEEIFYDDYVYDLETEKYHNFVGNGIFMHNTVQALTTIKDLLKGNPNAKVLILAPLTSLKTWIEENEKFTQLEVVLVRGNHKDKVEKWSKKANIYLTNHDSVKTKEFPDCEWDLIVIDEASRIKNFATQLRKKLGSIKSKKRIAVTASLIENNLDDLYSITTWVDKNILPPYRVFRQKFMKLSLDSAGGRTFYVIDGYKNLDKLREMLAPIYLRREKNEVGEQLPDLMFEKIWLSFNSNEKSEMNLIYKDIKEKAKEKSSTIGEIVKARVLCARAEQKAFELLDITKGTMGQVIVFSEFLDALDFSKSLLEKNGFSCGLISGRVKQEDRDTLVEEFQDSKIRVLFLQTKTGGYGLNLQKASTVVFLNRPYTLATEEQAWSRAHRTGQKNKVQVYYLLVENSFEHRVNKILEDKGYLTNEVIVSSLLEVDKNGEN